MITKTILASLWCVCEEIRNYIFIVFRYQLGVERVFLFCTLSALIRGEQQQQRVTSFSRQVNGFSAKILHTGSRRRMIKSNVLCGGDDKKGSCKGES